ncbi:hypothetical protein [Sphingomonas sp. R86520]|uniref:hypothetical protein n=1 Tax=Sphingomonas sp. R86520 TaxID=3093859 RepID=UPI0036D2BF3B
MLTFQPIRLEFNHGDEDAVLILREGQLVAIAARLGVDHGTAAGEWFVETVFTGALLITGRRYQTLDDIAAILDRT